MTEEEVWARLVAAVRADVPDLATRFLSRLGRSGSYRAGRVPDDDLRRTAEESLALLVDHLDRPDDAVDLGDLPDRLGRLRARQRVALDDLTDAVRLDFPVIWSALLDHADPAGVAVLARKADRLWEVVDTYARAVHAGFLSERALLAEQERDQERRQLDALFRPGPLPDARIAGIAAALGVDAEARFTVCAALGEGAVTLRGRAVRAAPGVLVREVDFGVVAFWPAGHDAGRTLAVLTAGVGCVVLDGVAGLARVRAAAGTAVHLAGFLEAGERVALGARELWTRVARDALERHGGLPSAVVGALADLRPDDAALLAGTAQAYLDSGSVSQVAADLFCHRNTVLNRLRRFRELTGLDLTRPREAALALVVLTGWSPAV